MHTRVRGGSAESQKNKKRALGKHDEGCMPYGVNAMRTCRNPSAFNFFPAIARGSPHTW
jgi:hypothetical protein